MIERTAFDRSFPTHRASKLERRLDVDAFDWIPFALVCALVQPRHVVFWCHLGGETDGVGVEPSRAITLVQRNFRHSLHSQWSFLRRPSRSSVSAAASTKSVAASASPRSRLHTVDFPGGQIDAAVQIADQHQLRTLFDGSRPDARPVEHVEDVEDAYVLSVRMRNEVRVHHAERLLAFSDRLQEDRLANRHHVLERRAHVLAPGDHLAKGHEVCGKLAVQDFVHVQADMRSNLSARDARFAAAQSQTDAPRIAIGGRRGPLPLSWCRSSAQRRRRILQTRQMEERDPSVDLTFGLEMGTVVGVEGFQVTLLQADNVCVIAEQFLEHKLLPHVDVEIADRTQRQSQKTGGEGAPGAAVSENALRVRPRNVGVGEDVVGDHAEGRGL